MASRSHLYTTAEVCDLVTVDGDDPKYLFPGSDDDLGDLDEEYDALDKEQS